MNEYDVLEFFLCYAAGAATACAVVWSVLRVASWRLKTASLVMKRASDDRVLAERARRDLAPLLAEGPHQSYGRRVHDHISSLKNERDEARSRADALAAKVSRMERASERAVRNIEDWLADNTEPGQNPVRSVLDV